MDLSPLSLSDLAKLNAPAQPLPPSDYPLHLELNQSDPRSYRQIIAIGTGSVLVHLIVFILGLELPSVMQNRQPERVIVEHKTPLYFPRELTQKAPNRNKVTKDIDLASLIASRQQQNQQQASPSASVRNFHPPQNMGVPQTSKTQPKIMPDAPNLALNQAPADLGAGVLNGVQSAPPPPNANQSPLQNKGNQAPPNPQPKIAPKPPPPGAVRPPLSDNSQSVPAPTLPGLAGQSGNQRPSIELLSDPQGADFKPYLEQVLAIVRANWQRVTPEAVRQGRLRGLSVIEFVINRDGSIPKVIVSQTSNVTQLDVVASTSLVMSSPLPRLPAEFKGFQVRLAFKFAYNMPIQ
jgi:hypothetical protein